MNESIKKYCKSRSEEFEQIAASRKKTLETLADYIVKKIKSNQWAQLIFVCTHNSRRSHFGQIWAAVAADYYEIDRVLSFSGGTETTAFHANAIAALERIGFSFYLQRDGENPIYLLSFGQQKQIQCFSKKYDDKSNPSNHFAAVMTCSDADNNCPFIPGVELRIATTYDDPKIYDNTPFTSEKYDERCAEIGREMMYVMHLVRLSLNE